MSLTSLYLMAAAIGTYPPTSGYSIGVDLAARKPIDQRGTESALAVRIGGLRPHVETREAGSVNALAILPRHRLAKRDARRIRMAAKRRRGWR